MPKMGADARLARRREFVDAARRITAEKGYRNLTVDDVCAEAGLSKGSFYAHFEEKRDLLFALLDEDAAAVEDLIAGVGGARSSGVARIRRFLQATLERSADPVRVRLRADLWAEAADDEVLRTRLAATVRERRARLAGWIDEAASSGEIVDVPSNAFAAVLLALGDGLMMHAAVDPGGFRWSNVGRAVTSLLDGLTRPEPPA